MQPDGQSPQPISTWTRKPSPLGTADHEQQAPITFGSLGPMPANRGSNARTIAAAASGLVAEVGNAEADGACEAVAEPDGAGVSAGVQAATKTTVSAAKARETDQRVIRRAARAGSR